MMPSGHWTEQQTEYLKEHYKFDGIRLCAAALDKSAKAIMQKAKRLGIKSLRKKPVVILSDDDESIISEMFLNDKPIRLICEKTGFSSKVVYRYIKKLGLARRAPRERKQRFCVTCGKPINNGRRQHCSSECKIKRSYEEWISLWHDGKIKHNPEQVSPFLRKYLFAKNNGSCQECGWNEVNSITGKCPLTVHHVDGNSANNVEGNLQLLCPNCHSLKPNYGSLNKGSGRLKRKLKLRELKESGG